MAKVKYNRGKPSNFAAFLCLCLAVLAFILSISLVRSRQKMVPMGRKISALEKNLLANAAKNAELDVKILQLCSSESLRALIVSDGLVLIDANNVVRVPKGEADLCAMANSEAKANAFASTDFQRQTSLTANN